MNDLGREIEDKLLDEVAGEVRENVTSLGKNLAIRLGQEWARKQLVRTVSENYPQEIAKHILANPHSSSSTLFLRAINALAGNAQGTAQFANKIAPAVGKYLAVFVDPAVTWIRMARDDHTSEEIIRETMKSLLLGMAKTSASTFLGPWGGTAAAVGIDALARHLGEQ
ncbi:hypothetical protein [Actinophytocola xanthii]|uniref:Uncharacterized protein n=1 Tax=Actinophytocola xanthii TaxID=1912961 RepID=A0A1Q8BS36_9PSEU|nr:hypothetical protein [Actinophytocola xanthii]OLF04924.1 hypothetical protein BU204_37535 [Actinophytocola xanthii]